MLVLVAQVLSLVQLLEMLFEAGLVAWLENGLAKLW